MQMTIANGCRSEDGNAHGRKYVASKMRWRREAKSSNSCWRNHGIYTGHCNNIQLWCRSCWNHENIGQIYGWFSCDFQVCYKRWAFTSECADRRYQCLHGRRQCHQNRCIACNVRNMGKIPLSTIATSEAIPTSSTKKRMISEIQLVYYNPVAEGFTRQLLVLWSHKERPIHSNSVWRARSKTCIGICRFTANFSKNEAYGSRNLHFLRSENICLYLLLSSSMLSLSLHFDLCSSIYLTCFLFPIFSTTELVFTRSQSFLHHGAWGISITREV